MTDWGCGTRLEKKQMPTVDFGGVEYLEHTAAGTFQANFPAIFYLGTFSGDVTLDRRYRYRPVQWHLVPDGLKLTHCTLYFCNSLNHQLCHISGLSIQGEIDVLTSN